MDPPPLPPQGIDDPQHTYREATESIKAHRAALRQLEDVRAMCVHEIHAQGASFAEIATSLGLSRARIQQLVHRGRVLTARQPIDPDVTVQGE